MSSFPDLEKAIYQQYATIHFSEAHQNAAAEFPRYCLYFDANYSQYLPQNKEAVVVDLACGLGHFLYFLKEKGYQNALGVDMSPECVGHCSQQGFHVEQQNMFDWLENKQVDAIVANDVLEHLNKEELNRFLYLAHRALKPGGVLITKVPNAANPVTGGALRYIDYTHRLSFTELSLKAVMKVYFPKTHVFGQKLFVFYKNPLNYLGMLGQFLWDKFFYMMAYLYGQGELKIFKKSILSVSYKE